MMCLVAGTAGAQDKKTLAIVVKGLDNPFFEQINLGCQKWQAENPDADYTCLYTGPASSADEAGEVQIVDDLLTTGVAAIAISPSNAPAMGNLIRRERADHPGDDDRRRLRRGRPRRCGRPISAPTTT